MKEYWGSGGIAPRILNSALDGGGCSASEPGRFTPRESARRVYCIGGWVGPQSRSRRGGEEKNFHPLTVHETPIIQSVAQRYTTELPHSAAAAVVVVNNTYWVALFFQASERQTHSVIRTLERGRHRYRLRFNTRPNPPYELSVKNVNLLMVSDIDSYCSNWFSFSILL
jgi:hypothetical protein